MEGQLFIKQEVGKQQSNSIVQGSGYGSQWLRFSGYCIALYSNSSGFDALMGSVDSNAFQGPESSSSWPCKVRSQ